MDKKTKYAYLSTIRGLTGGDTRKVYVVSGAPASGKTTYVKEHMKKGDLVFDLDYICAALAATSLTHEDHEPVLDVALAIRDTVYEMIQSRDGNWNNAYVITASKDMYEVRQLVRDLDADHIHIDTPQCKCIENAKADPLRQATLNRQLELINDYFYNN